MSSHDKPATPIAPHTHGLGEGAEDTVSITFTELAKLLMGAPKDITSRPALLAAWVIKHTPGGAATYKIIGSLGAAQLVNMAARRLNMTTGQRLAVRDFVREAITGMTSGALENLAELPEEVIAKRLEDNKPVKATADADAGRAGYENTVVAILPTAVAVRMAHKPKILDGKIDRDEYGIERVAVCETYHAIVRAHLDRHLKPGTVMLAQGMGNVHLTEAELIAAINRGDLDPCPSCHPDLYAARSEDKVLRAAAAEDHGHEEKHEEPKGNAFLHELKNLNYGAWRMLMATANLERGVVDHVLQNDLSGDMMREGMNPDVIIAQYNELKGRGLVKIMTPAEYEAWKGSDAERKWLGASLGWWPWIMSWWPKKLTDWYNSFWSEEPTSTAASTHDDDVTPEQMVYVVHPRAADDILSAIDFYGPGEQDWKTRSLLWTRRTWRSISRHSWLAAGAVAFVAAVLVCTGVSGAGLIALVSVKVYHGVWAIGDALDVNALKQGLTQLVNSLIPEPDPVTPKKWQEAITTLIKVTWFVLAVTWTFKFGQALHDIWHRRVKDEPILQIGRAMVGALVASFVIGTFAIISNIIGLIVPNAWWLQDMDFVLKAVGNLILLIGIANPILLRYNGLNGHALKLSLQNSEILQWVGGTLPWVVVIGAVLVTTFTVFDGWVTWSVVLGNWKFFGAMALFVAAAIAVAKLKGNQNGQIGVGLMATVLFLMLIFGGFDPTWKETSALEETIAQTELEIKHEAAKRRQEKAAGQVQAQLPDAQPKTHTFDKASLCKGLPYESRKRLDCP